MHSGDKTRQIEAVRQKTIAVLEDMGEKAGDFELAQPPPALEEYRRKLEENAYEVLVVGQAKRGKSTFVNALIGEDVLPTDVDVATSQVFKISHSEREGYRLRFEDGSQREDLARRPLALRLAGCGGRRGGTHSGPDDPLDRGRNADPVPARGVSILDTPGLGSLYAGHARITHRFVPHADAVIFVLEFDQPIVDADVEVHRGDP